MTATEANVLFLCFFYRMMLSPIVLYASLATTFSLVKSPFARKPEASEGSLVNATDILPLRVHGND